MKREEQILKAGIEYTIANKPKCIAGDNFKDLADILNRNPDFEQGALWADKHPHWISVEEELPKQNEPVLVYNGLHEFIFVGIYSKGNWFYTEPIIKEEDNITHWMRLPQPPHHFADVSKKVKKGGEK